MSEGMREIEEKYQLIMKNFRAAADNLNSMNNQLDKIVKRQEGMVRDYVKR